MVVDRSGGPPWKVAQVPSSRCLERIQAAAPLVRSSVRMPRNSRSRRSSASMLTLVSRSPFHQPSLSWRASSLPAPRSSAVAAWRRSEEHTSELQSRRDIVCRLLHEKKKVEVINFRDLSVMNSYLFAGSPLPSD